MRYKPIRYPLQRISRHILPYQEDEVIPGKPRKLGPEKVTVLCVFH